MKKKKLLIYGSQDFGWTVRQIALDSGYTIAGFIDDIHPGDGVLGDFSKVKESHSPEEYEVAMAIGYGNLKARLKVMERVKEYGYTLATLIHPRAYVCSTATIEEGAIIMNNAVIDMRTRIGEGAVVWPGVVVNHDSVVEGNTFISPNATICGHCMIGKNCFVGAGSVVADHRTVPPESFVKAGSVFV
ncbi:DapH/DapD/GlmU-related protein [Falsibacillus pallidus]|uniref:UDP-N-acetylbacillosamine N-acetyltransferase n=1 Tax=Falsibacillus pallidus TaxID=493781 RepID=A0A370G8I1_9BACI|nr:DapH/DapD/GlmU-related protein [Falsibacillus pallidus]RDI40108.1 UDP-N-acetylbacillosamine N-acetyltransferase [Falsibacillus pallidus]